MGRDHHLGTTGIIPAIRTSGSLRTGSHLAAAWVDLWERMRVEPVAGTKIRERCQARSISPQRQQASASGWSPGDAIFARIPN